MKDFTEFISSLTQDDINWICGADDSDSEKLSVNLTDPDSGNKIAAFISGHSFFMNLRLLELYHKWFSEQLEK